MHATHMRRGFTLVEMLVVAGIIVILAALFFSLGVKDAEIRRPCQWSFRHEKHWHRTGNLHRR